MVPLLWPSKCFLFLFVWFFYFFIFLGFPLVPCIFPMLRIWTQLDWKWFYIWETQLERKSLCVSFWMEAMVSVFQVQTSICSEAGHVGGHGWRYSYKGDLNLVPSKWNFFAEVLLPALVYQVRSFRRWNLEVHRGFLKGLWISSCRVGHSMYSVYLGQSVSL